MILQEDCHESALVEELESLYGYVKEAEVWSFMCYILEGLTSCLSVC